MAQAQTNETPIEDIYNPNSQAYLDSPVSACLALAKRGRLVWYEPWQAWIMTRMPDICSSRCRVLVSGLSITSAAPVWIADMRAAVSAT